MNNNQMRFLSSMIFVMILIVIMMYSDSNYKVSYYYESIDSYRFDKLYVPVFIMIVSIVMYITSYFPANKKKK